MSISPMVYYKAVIAKHVFPDCYQEVDGYWVWGPREIYGAWSAADLEMIARLLNEANRKWDNEIKAYFRANH